MKDTQGQKHLPGVPQAKQGREVAPKWEWTEASGWTERMLATLERGITGGKWYSLIDKVWKMENLQSAAKKVAAGKSEQKADGRKCRRYAETSHRRLPALQVKLKSGDYRPEPVQRIWIPKPGSKELRPLGVPRVEDRVVEMAVRNVIEPIFENVFAEQSYGFRPKRGAKDALRRVTQLLEEGRCWVVDADIKGYFDNIPRDQMMQALGQHISDGKLLDLIEQMLNKGVMERAKGWQPTEKGTPQGAEPPTGKPDAGKSHVRFGGRGEVLFLVPTPITRFANTVATGHFATPPCRLSLLSKRPQHLGFSRN